MPLPSPLKAVLKFSKTRPTFFFFYTTGGKPAELRLNRKFNDDMSAFGSRLRLGGLQSVWKNPSYLTFFFV